MSIIADRYASLQMREIWSPMAKIIAERKLWIAVLRFQSKHGIDIPERAISDYEKVIERVDLASIDRRERESRHDVKARIDEFNALAGHQFIHLGMTSRDLTENIEAHQIRQSLNLIHERSAALLYRLGERANQYRELPIVARSHNVPAQLTTLGKKFANFAEELLIAHTRLTNLIERYPNRGIKGPVGTAQDGLDLLGKDHARLESEIAKTLGFESTLDSTGQIYPRSLDFEVVSALVQLSAAPANMATSIRLMAGNELVSEGFKAGQVGSSAMPHKMNSRSCERINGLAVVLRGYLSMISELVGDQWNEGDVSDSVVRRVALSDAFYTIDGIIETALTVLAEFGIFEARINAEVEANLPYLATTKILMAAVKAGAGRESAHEALKELSTKALIENRTGRPTSLIDAIANDPRIPLDSQTLQAILRDPREFVGAAPTQVSRVIAKIDAAIAQIPSARTYHPSQIR